MAEASSLFGFGFRSIDSWMLSFLVLFGLGRIDSKFRDLLVFHVSSFRSASLGNHLWNQSISRPNP